LVVAIGACSGTNVSVVSGNVTATAGPDEDGQILIERRDGPPIEANIGKNGIEEVTPTPGPITPIIPVATPQPTATPRP
jgi:hypothetical protein